ncbi:hypothetical protein Tco_1031421 [Tanacetum coccineum]|uniref:Transposase (putative) gypsy type domain-containing protein n=1 Tax=Tanacetum coccineum TaxID=301880 RepID=A0ABQ5GAH3_9ASTR
MSAITNVKRVLTQKALDAFCNKFYIPEEVHPVLPNQNDTMHERPARKIGLYTRFFDFANFRLPLSTFLVDVLRHFRINISQLFVIGATKVSHFEILCRVYGIIPTIGLFRCFYVNSKKSGWMSFSKRSDNASHVTRDPALVEVDFNAQDYATLVARPSPFRKFPEAFLCLNKGEARLLDTTISSTVPPLPVAPDRAESQLEASVEKLFNEGGSGNQTEQGDSAGGGQDANIQPVVKAADTAVEDVALVQPRRQGKRKYVIVDTGGASHPPKKLRKDHRTPSETSVGGKSRSAIKRLLAGAVLNVEVGVAAIPTLPFVTTSVSTTPERESEDHTDSVAELNLHTIGAPRRSFVPIMTTVTTITLTVDPTSVAKEKLVEPSSFCAGSSSAGGTDPTTGVFSDLTEFNIGAARQMSLSAEVRMRAEYNVKEKRRLKSVVDRQTELLKVREGEIENLKAQLLLREAEDAEVIRLRAEASNFEIVTELEASAASKERELTNLNALVTSVKSQNDNLADRVHELEISFSGLQEKVTVYENCMDQLGKFQDDRMKIVNDKFDKLYTDFVEMTLYLEEKFYPHLLTTISGRRWLLTHGMELAIVNCLNSPEYLFALGAAIGKAIKKGMQDGLSAGITHGKEDRVLTNVAAHNPYAEVAYISALQHL